MRRGLIFTAMIVPAMLALTGARPVWAASGGGIPQPTASRQLLDVEGIAVEKRTLAYKHAGGCAILADVYTLPNVKRASAKRLLASSFIRGTSRRRQDRPPSRQAATGA